MRFLSIGRSVILIAMLITMQLQQQEVEAKPFIFKFFVPQAPARTDSSSSSLSPSSSSISTGIDFTSILNTKLNLLTSLLRTGLSNGISGGFNIGFKKFFPIITGPTTRRPCTSTTRTTPDLEFEAESIIKSTTTMTSTTTESPKNDKVTGSDILSEPIDNKKDNTNTDDGNTNMTNGKNDHDYHGLETTAKEDSINYDKAIVDKTQNNDSGYDYTTTKINTSKPNGYGYSTPPSDYNYDNSNQAMSENEISNEVMMINSQYLPPF